MRTIEYYPGYESEVEGESEPENWEKGSTIKSTSNILILDEDLLTRFVTSEYEYNEENAGELTRKVVQAYLEQQRLMKADLG